MNLTSRNPMYFLFIGIQLKFVARDPDNCDEKVGLLTVQIGSAIEIGVKLFVFLIFLYTDRFSTQPGGFSKCLSCFIPAGIMWSISFLLVVFGITLFKKVAFWLGLQGFSFLNEGLLHLYHLKTYK